MKNILLVCANGLSTSLLASNIKKAAEKQGQECNVIIKNGASDLPIDKKIDVCLIGPQLREKQLEIQKQLPNVKLGIIDMRVYAIGDGEAALDQARSLAS